MEEGTGHKLDLHIPILPVLPRAVGPDCAGGRKGGPISPQLLRCTQVAPGEQAKMDPIPSPTPVPLPGLVKPAVPPLWK